MAGRLAKLPPRWRLALRWPWPLRKPFERSVLVVAAFGGGLGDELMCTPILREIKRRNPRIHLTFRTRYPELFRDFPHADAILPHDAPGAETAVILTYADAVPPARPLVALAGECAGLEVAADELDPLWFEPLPAIRAALAAAPGPRIVVQPLTSQWTPNKQWPLASWRTLIARLTERFSVIEVGTAPAFPGEDFGPRFSSWSGRTDHRELASLLAQADVFVGPDSGGLHLANVCRVPSVAIFGGYTAPEGVPYRRMESFYTPEPCAPCWLTSPCPYDIPCLRKIEPEAVFAAVCRLVEKEPARA